VVNKSAAIRALEERGWRTIHTLTAFYQSPRAQGNCWTKEKECYVKDNTNLRCLGGLEASLHSGPVA
jgi:hypothetical protein